MDLSRYFRVFTFAGEVLGMVKNNPRLASPLAINLGVATFVNIVFAVVYMLLSDNGPLAYAILPLGLVALYFVDYFSAGIAVSLIHDQVTTNQAELGTAFKRTLKATPGILVFATVSGFLDWIANWARDRGGIVGTIVIGIIRLIWTTATYVVMPAMVIEGIGFFAAFKRSRDLMKNDPTQVGVGVVGLGVVSFVLGVVCFGAAYGAFQVFSGIPLLAVLIFFTMVNLYWALTGYLKITYYTCFYLWARECETRGVADPSFAPAPLANTIAPAFVGA